MFALAIGVSVLPAVAQQPQQPKPEEDQKKKEEPKDPFGSDGDKSDKKDEKKLVDAEGRDYTRSARNAPTTCISRDACGCVRTAVIAMWNEQSG